MAARALTGRPVMPLCTAALLALDVAEEAPELAPVAMLAPPEVTVLNAPAPSDVTVEKAPPAPEVTVVKTPPAPEVTVEKAPAAPEVTVEKAPAAPEVTSPKTLVMSLATAIRGPPIDKNDALRQFQRQLQHQERHSWD